jgi:hypothetical protein
VSPVSNDPLERLVFASRVYRAAAAAARTVAVAFQQSVVVGRAARIRRGFTTVPGAERIRLAGWLLAAAAATHGILAALMPRSMAPSPRFAVPILVGAAGLVLMALAPAIARAWTWWRPSRR